MIWAKGDFLWPVHLSRPEELLAVLVDVKWEKITSYYSTSAYFAPSALRLAVLMLLLFFPRGAEAVVSVSNSLTIKGLTSSLMAGRPADPLARRSQSGAVRKLGSVRPHV